MAIIYSCGKDDDAPPPEPPQVDTLTAGWTKITVTAAANDGFSDIFFVNNNTGWAAGKYLYKSSDGGINWSKQAVLDDTSFSNLFFISESTGWAVGSKGIYRTTTGGNLWIKITASAVAEPFDVQFLNPRLGYLAGKGGLYRSIDSGLTWTSINSALGPTGALYFIDSLQGWTFFNGKPAFTSNAGVNFSPSAAYTGDDQYAMQFIDPSTGWVAGFNSVYRTTNAGASWTKLTNAQGADIHFFDKDAGYICAGGSVFKTTNGGTTLNRVASLANTPGFIEMHFTDANHGWVATMNNIILRYAQ